MFDNAIFYTDDEKQETKRDRLFSIGSLLREEEHDNFIQNSEHRQQLIIITLLFLLIIVIILVALIFYGMEFFPQNYHLIPKHNLLCVEDEYANNFEYSLSANNITELIFGIQHIKAGDLHLFPQVFLMKMADTRWNDPVRIFQSFDNYTCILDFNTLSERQLKSCILDQPYNEEFIYNIEENIFIVPSKIKHFESICRWFHTGNQQIFSTDNKIIPIIEGEFAFFIHNPQEIPQLYLLDTLDKYYPRTQIIEKPDVSNLQEMLGFDKKAKLIYNATDMSYTNDDFHKYVDNHSNLLIVLQVNQYNDIYKFGAYISVEYKKNKNLKGYINDEKAFLFTLESNSNIKSHKFAIVDPSTAVRYDESVGIKIGCGTDIGIEERFFDERQLYPSYYSRFDTLYQNNAYSIMYQFKENGRPFAGSVWSKFKDGSFDIQDCDTFNCKLFGDKNEENRYVSARFTHLEVFTFN
ncbi:hypothetical protein WA158_007261 [Blastocystis sp. Blastoise]